MPHVLIVDDHPDLCLVLVRLLAIAGHEAQAVLDGAAAIDFVRATPPSLVLLDVMMPGLNGFDVLRELRADPRTSFVPVVMYTALSDPESHQKAIDMGAADYVLKSTTSLDGLKQLVATHARPPHPPAGP